MECKLHENRSEERSEGKEWLGVDRREGDLKTEKNWCKDLKRRELGKCF